MDPEQVFHNLDWVERFWSKVDKSSECWVWNACVDDKGYGKFKLGGKTYKAHRISFRLSNGFWPYKGLHECDNPPCVRVDKGHVYSGTMKDNVDDMWLRNRAKPWSKVSDDDVRTIRLKKNSGMTVRLLSNDYNLSISTISRICTGVNHGSVL